MGRAPCCEKVGLKKGRWTADEDEILIKYIQANGEGSWRSLPKNAGLLRCGKSCRLRWINYLRADLKRGNISPQEEHVIIRLHASLGNRWSLIASHLPGRTDNEIKNYWNSHLCRRIDTFRRVTNISDTTKMIMDVHSNSNIPPKRRRGGKTSRWAMKKNKSNRKERDQKRKESSTVGVINEKEAVPVPTTLAVENEILSTAMEDFMALEAEQVDNSSESDARVTSCDQDQGLQLEEVEIPDQTEDIDGGGALCIDDSFDPSWLLDDGDGVSTLNDERDGHFNKGELVGVVNNANESDIGRVDFSCPPKMAARQELETEKRDHEEWFSSVTTSVFYDNWDWDMDWDGAVLQLENHESRDESWLADKEELVSWLWEDDHDWESTDSQNLPDIESDIGKVDFLCPPKMAASQELELETEKRDREEWFSSVTTSVFYDNWDMDWDGAVLQLENHESRDESWLADKEELVSWLWEDDHDWESTDSQNLRDIDPEKYNAVSIIEKYEE
ncbi:hypothetical protein L6164_010281 [Bauhinia variegata]|uniref:Uncharacterized protein n=1 Tax=Bauhinia variegata TaxID=167791 RepID=A0ACB9PML7_BAUVA|nr:hypothetical protein L6164_010281 [Bauhinia variegata]